jgi:RND family efflux transporter MFP subunit
MTIERIATSSAPTPSSAPLFPDAPTPRRRRWARAVVAVAVVALAAAGAGIAGADRPVELRTATAGVHDVAATLYGVATLEPVLQATVAFPADGTVSTVDVAVGDEVVVGQQLASLDPDELTESLHVAEARLADAELALRRALDGEDVSSTTGVAAGTATPTSTDEGSTEVVWALSSSATTGTATTTAAAATVTTTTASPTSTGALASLQRAVLDAQVAVDAALATSEAALASADEVCATAVDATVDRARDADTSTSTSTTVAAAAADTDSCRAAVGEVLVAQQATAAAQAQLAAAATALDEHLLSVETGSSGTGDGGAGAGAGTTADTSSGASSSAAGGSSTSSSPSSAELIALQQQVDAAALGVMTAQQALARASIVAPIDGTVVAVALEAGDEVTAGSSTQTITIQGDDGMEAVSTVALSEVADVSVGQPATVVSDGSEVELVGEVVAVAAVPDEDSDTSSYRVTIGFPDGAAEVGNGTTGSIAIVTDDVRATLAVPTSAVTWTDSRATVQVRGGDGVVGLVAVELGVIGPEWTEIRAGVDDGDVVVLADPAEALPGRATDAEGSAAAATSGAAGGGFPEGFEPPSGGFSGGGPPSGS